MESGPQGEGKFLSSSQIDRGRYPHARFFRFFNTIKEDYMDIINLPIDRLIPYANNPRNNNNSVDLVAASIKEFGFKVPIIVDREYVIVAGHTRLLAAKKLGLDEVPCLIADDLTDAQIKAFRLADNKVSEFSGWDMDKLVVEMEMIEFDMTEFGFKADFLIKPEPIDLEDSQNDNPNDNKKTYHCPKCGFEFGVDE